MPRPRPQPALRRHLRVKTTKKDRGFGLGKISGLVGAGDFKKEDIEVSTDCGVDIRLVDPTSGEIAVAQFSEYNRKDTAAAMGVEILGANAQADVEMEVSEDDYGKILRLALDDALRKMLPEVDNVLLTRQP